MRVLFVEVSHDILSPEFRVHAELVGAVSSGDLESLTVTHPNVAGGASDGLSRVGVDLVRKGSTRSKRVVNLAIKARTAVPELLQIAREFGPDIIYSSQQRTDILLAELVRRRLGIGTRVTHLHYGFGPWLGRTAARLVKEADHIVAVSEFVRQSVLLRGGHPGRISTITNCLRSTRAIAPSKDEKRRSLGLSKDDIVIAMVGRLDPGKGHALTFEALARLGSDVDQFRVLVCGSSAQSSGYEDQLRHIATVAGLDDIVTFLGHRSDVAELLEASDIFCLPSEMEPCALVYFEAMRASLPIVALYSGGTPELVTHRSTGLLSYPGDSASLARHLAELAEDRELRSSMGQASHDRLEHAFDPTSIAAKWLEVLRSVAAK